MGLQGSRVQIPPSRCSKPARWPASSFSLIAADAMHRLLLLGLLLALPGCDLNAFRRTPIEHAGFAKELHVDTTAMTTTPSGLRYEDLTVGNGPAAGAGNTVSVRYSGWLTNGK